MFILSLQKIKTSKISMLIIFFVLFIFFVVSCASEALNKKLEEVGKDPMKSPSEVNNEG